MRKLYIGFLAGVDLSAFLISFLLSSHTLNVFNNKFFSNFLTNVLKDLFLKLWWLPLVYIFFIGYEKLYTRRLPFWEEAKELIKSVILSTAIALVIIFVGKIKGINFQEVLILTGIYGIMVFPFFRYIGKNFLHRFKIGREKVLIVGAGNAGTSVARGIGEDIYLGYEVVGFLDDAPEKAGQEIKVGNNVYKVFGKLQDFPQVLEKLKVKKVIIAIPSLEREKLCKLVNEFQKYTNEIFVVPELKGIALLNTELHYLFMEQLFLIKIKNNLKVIFNQFLKRTFDIIVSILLLPLVIPIIVVFGVLIKLDSEGPVFFIQHRLGRGEKTFKCIKFRTMYMNSDKILEEYLAKNPKAKEEWEKFKKLKGYDPRVTRVGRFLRKTSLDELPQIFNVLKGDMSLVGPRPYLPREVSDMGEFKDIILTIRPGITGLWQISGRNELTFKDRLKLDTWYVLNWSFWLDIVILFKTIKVVLKGEGAY